MVLLRRLRAATKRHYTAPRELYTIGINRFMLFVETRE